jgi:ferredoxin
MRLREYRGQHIAYRPNDMGEDRIALIPNLEYKPEELNLYSEVDPLQENVPPLRGLNKMAYMLVHHKRELIPEISPTLPALIYMEALQGLVDKNMVRKHSGPRPDPARLKEGIKDYAASLGFALCGVTSLDRRFVTRGNDHKFPYSTAVVLGMEMRKEFMLQAPNYRLRNYPDYDVYRRAGIRIHKVANFVRRQGVSCSVRIPFDGAVVYPPHALTAGLGELGAFGGVLSPEFGPRQRWGMITVDADLPLDQPADYGIAGFCEECLLCIKKCPAKAIPEEPIWWRGVYKRKINDLKCWAFFTGWHTCAICVNSCPMHRFGYQKVMEHYVKTGEVLGYEEIMAERPAYRRMKNLNKLMELVQ